MSGAEDAEATRRALVEAARERLSTHLREEDTALAADDPARAALRRLAEQLREPRR